MHSGRYTYPCVSNAWWMTVSASATSGAMGRGDFASACTSSATCCGSNRMLSDDRVRRGDCCRRRGRAVRRARRMGCPMSTRIHSPSRKSAADSRHNPENTLPHRDSANRNEAGLSLLQTFSRQPEELIIFAIYARWKYYRRRCQPIAKSNASRAIVSAILEENQDILMRNRSRG